MKHKIEYWDDFKYQLWFKNGQLIDVRNMIDSKFKSFGFSVSKNSEVWEYFSQKY